MKHKDKKANLKYIPALRNRSIPAKFLPYDFNFKKTKQVFGFQTFYTLTSLFSFILSSSSLGLSPSAL